MEAIPRDGEEIATKATNGGRRKQKKKKENKGKNVVLEVAQFRRRGKGRRNEYRYNQLELDVRQNDDEMAREGINERRRIISDYNV